MVRSKTWFSLAAAVLGCMGAAQGQSRVGEAVRSPGSLNRPGQGSASSTLRRYSSGLGSLGRTGGGHNSVLRSRMQSNLTTSSMRVNSRGSAASLRSGVTAGTPGGLTVRRGSGVDVGRNTGTPRRAREARRFDLPSFRLQDSRRPVIGRARSAHDPAETFLSAMGVDTAADGPLEAGSDEPIRSLAPEGQGMYAQYMRKGEMLMKQGQYSDAYSQFHLANQVAEDDPESLLHMAHARFATSMYSYASTCHYLRQALRRFPSLPMVNIRPRSFFAEAPDYQRSMRFLQEAVERSSADTRTQLVLAYFLWTDGKYDAAARVMRTAHRHAREADMREDLQKFWQGMLATGKVSGTLGGETRRPATGPAASSSSD